MVETRAGQQAWRFFSRLDRDGFIFCTDKPMWLRDRSAWALSLLYNTVEKRREWLEHAKRTIALIDKHGFDSDDRMFYLVAAEGRPLRKRRYLFSETFAVIAFAEFGMAIAMPRALNAPACFTAWFCVTAELRTCFRQRLCPGPAEP